MRWLEPGPMLLVGASSVFAAVVAALDRPVLEYLRAAGGQVAPLGWSSGGEALYGVLWFLPTVAMTFLLAWGARRRAGRALALGVAGSLAFTAFWVLAFSYWWAPFLPTLGFLALSGSAFLLAVRGRVRQEWGAPFQVWLSAGFGVLLALVLPAWTVLAMLGFASCWDAWAVFRGPLGGMVSAMKQDEKVKAWFGRTLVVKAGQRGVGMGDLTFYSALVALGAFVSGWLALEVYAAVLVGTGATFWLLKRRKWPAAPGLPLPVALSAAVLLAAWASGAPL